MRITATELFLRLTVAILLGGSIGYERLIHRHPAGLRTHMLVALASATFMIVTTRFIFFQHYPNDIVLRVDVSRIGWNLVVGIGFLGGGAILHAGMKIEGLTTAASLWPFAAVGMAAGGGMYLLATTSALASLFTLEVLRRVEEPGKGRITIRVRLQFEGNPPSRSSLAVLLHPLGVQVGDVNYGRNLSADRSKLATDLTVDRSIPEEFLMTQFETLPGLRTVGMLHKG